jgi:hypothetical protein
LDFLAGGQLLFVGAVCSNPTKMVSAPISAYAKAGLLRNDSWTLIRVPLTEFCAAGLVQSIFVQDASGAADQNAAYMDDMQLIEGEHSILQGWRCVV